MIKNIIKHLQVPKRFILNIGISPAILLSELLDKERFLLNEGKLNKDEYFFHEYLYIYKNTGLLKSKFTTARKKLEELGIITNKYGEGKRLLYKISEEKLLEIFFPQSKYELIEDDFIELILEDGYIFYPPVLSHKIGINETIFIKSLFSKRKSFLSKNQLKNGYFFNSVSNIKNDTSLSRDQQLKCIKNLVNLNLIDVKYDYDNTRYFCINISLLTKFELIDLNELINIDIIKHDKAESGKSDKNNNKNITLCNPFTDNNIKNPKTDTINNDKADVIKNNSEKNDNTISGNIDKLGIEELKGYINKNKKENKETIIKNNNKKMLLSPFFKNINTLNTVANNYSIEQIEKAVNETNNRKLDNPSGFLKWALDNNIDFSSKNNISYDKNNIIKNENLIKEKEYSIIRDRILEEKKLYHDWKINNKELYNKIFNDKKFELNTGITNAIKLNIDSEIETKKYIKKMYIK